MPSFLDDLKRHIRNTGTSMLYGYDPVDPTGAWREVVRDYRPDLPPPNTKNPYSYKDWPAIPGVEASADWLARKVPRQDTRTGQAVSNVVSMTGSVLSDPALWAEGFEAPELVPELLEEALGRWHEQKQRWGPMPHHQVAAAQVIDELQRAKGLPPGEATRQVNNALAMMSRPQPTPSATVSQQIGNPSGPPAVSY